MEFYQINQPEDWNELRPIYEVEKGQMPNWLCSNAAIAKDEKGLAGFWSVQLVPHAGPLWIREDLRGTGLWKPLNEKLESEIIGKIPGTGYFIFSGHPKVETIAQKLDFTQLPYKVWKKVF